MSSGELDEPAPRRIVANLDCEVDFATASSPGGRSPGPLPGRVLETLAGTGTLLRAFAREDDRLWLPRAIDPAAMAELPGLPRPPLDSGPPGELSRAGAILAWGETAWVSRLRDRATPPPRRGGSAAFEELGLHRGLWHLPVPPAAAAAAVNDRAFCLELAAALGCRLPGSRTVASPRELARHLEQGGARASPHGAWVLKARFSAAGRWRYVHPPDRATDHRRIERLFARHGPLVFEPWMDRMADFGVCAALTADGWRRLGGHRQLLDLEGRFLGVELTADPSAPDPWLDEPERLQLESALSEVAAALARAGYRGPFGIDAWRHRRANGTAGFHPLGEINARMTVGLLARALVDRLRDPLGWAPRDRVRLCFGRPLEGQGGVARVPLLHPTRPSDRAIWLETCPA